MVNNYDVAVLSEKVAYLEAAIKNAGIELPEVTSEDNGKTLQVINGAWATGDKIPDVPGVINALDSTSTTDALSAAQGKVLYNKLVSASLTYDSSSDRFEYDDVLPSPSIQQLTVGARNTTNGAIYLLWYSTVSNNWLLAAVINGNNPANGEKVNIQYFAS